MNKTKKAFALFAALLGIIIISVLKDWEHAKESTRIENPAQRERTVSSEERNAKTTHTNYFTVSRVVDGDTIVIDNGSKVRYIGIDTPETKHPQKGVEFYGKEASAFNRRLVEGKRVKLEFDVQRKDRYGRTLAYVYLSDGSFVNAELVKRGYAKVATYPPNVRYQNLFLKLQRQARKQKRGLWKRL